jgi:hypothetical protein
LQYVVAPFRLPESGLNSEIQIGPVKFVERVEADETSALSGVIVGNTLVDGISISEDWNALNGNEDYNTQPNSIDDWGANAGVVDNYDFFTTATNDGHNVGLQGEEALQVVNAMGGANTYSPQGWSAIYHRFRLSATEPNQGFALKYIEIGGNLTGRMTFNG